MPIVINHNNGNQLNLFESLLTATQFTNFQPLDIINVTGKGLTDRVLLKTITIKNGGVSIDLDLSDLSTIKSQLEAQGIFMPNGFTFPSAPLVPTQSGNYALTVQAQKALMQIAEKAGILDDDINFDFGVAVTQGSSNTVLAEQTVNRNAEVLTVQDILNETNPIDLTGGNDQFLVEINPALYAVEYLTAGTLIKFESKDGLDIGVFGTIVVSKGNTEYTLKINQDYTIDDNGFEVRVNLMPNGASIIGGITDNISGSAQSSVNFNFTIYTADRTNPILGKLEMSLNTDLSNGCETYRAVENAGIVNNATEALGDRVWKGINAHTAGTATFAGKEIDYDYGSGLSANLGQYLLATLSDREQAAEILSSVISNHGVPFYHIQQDIIEAGAIWVPYYGVLKIGGVFNAPVELAGVNYNVITSIQELKELMNVQTDNELYENLFQFNLDYLSLANAMGKTYDEIVALHDNLVNSSTNSQQSNGNIGSAGNTGASQGQTNGSSSNSSNDNSQVNNIDVPQTAVKTSEGTMYSNVDKDFIVVSVNSNLMNSDKDAIIVNNLNSNSVLAILSSNDASKLNYFVSNKSSDNFITYKNASGSEVKIPIQNNTHFTINNKGEVKLTAAGINLINNIPQNVSDISLSLKNINATKANGDFDSFSAEINLSNQFSNAVDESDSIVANMNMVNSLNQSSNLAQNNSSTTASLSGGSMLNGFGNGNINLIGSQSGNANLSGNVSNIGSGATLTGGFTLPLASITDGSNKDKDVLNFSYNPSVMNSGRLDFNSLKSGEAFIIANPSNPAVKVGMVLLPDVKFISIANGAKQNIADLKGGTDYNFRVDSVTGKIEIYFEQSGLDKIANISNNGANPIVSNFNLDFLHSSGVDVINAGIVISPSGQQSGGSGGSSLTSPTPPDSNLNSDLLDMNRLKTDNWEERASVDENDKDVDFVKLVTNYNKDVIYKRDFEFNDTKVAYGFNVEKINPAQALTQFTTADNSPLSSFNVQSLMEFRVASDPSQIVLKLVKGVDYQSGVAAQDRTGFFGFTEAGKAKLKAAIDKNGELITKIVFNAESASANANGTKAVDEFVWYSSFSDKYLTGSANGGTQDSDQSGNSSLKLEMVDAVKNSSGEYQKDIQESALSLTTPIATINFSGGDEVGMPEKPKLTGISGYQFDDLFREGEIKDSSGKITGWTIFVKDQQALDIIKNSQDIGETLKIEFTKSHSLTINQTNDPKTIVEKFEINIIGSSSNSNTGNSNTGNSNSQNIDDLMAKISTNSEYISKLSDVVKNISDSLGKFMNSAEISKILEPIKAIIETKTQEITELAEKLSDMLGSKTTSISEQMEAMSADLGLEDASPQDSISNDVYTLEVDGEKVLVTDHPIDLSSANHNLHAFVDADSFSF
ncbi:MAG: hypothetical protein SFT90_06490 [Rickettsiales bacterium]|nr:hypothetical protein [Rickettsiales bacterium]